VLYCRNKCVKGVRQGMRLDTGIPYCNCLMRLDEPLLRQEILPDGYEIRPYRDGDGPGWAAVEAAVGEFESDEAALDCFEKYIKVQGEAALAARSFFAVKNGRVVGVAGAMTDERNGKAVPSVHWVAVHPDHQNRGLGRALMIRVINFYARNHQKPVYLHTQSWSWAAVRLYASLGFALMRKDTFKKYENQYALALELLAMRLPADEVAALARQSVE